MIDFVSVLTSEKSIICEKRSISFEHNVIS